MGRRIDRREIAACVAVCATRTGGALCIDICSVCVWFICDYKRVGASVRTFGRMQKIVINIVIFALGCVIFCVEFSGCAAAIGRGAGTWRRDHWRERLGHCLSSVFCRRV